MLEVHDLDEAAGTSVPAVDGRFSTESSKAKVSERFCRRSVDLLFSAIGLIVLLPLLFVIGGFARAKLDDKRT